MAGTATENRSNALRQISADAPRYSGFTSLDAQKREIRVLDLCAGLHCRLRTVSLDDGPKYSALSYYWGPPSATPAITVNGETVRIRKTVYQFLETLYEVRGLMTVWLDLICINQRDVSEQSTQVAMMGEIYTQAEQVYAWLGQGEPDPQYALSYVNCSDDGRNAYNTKSVLLGIIQLFSHRYFTRVWILQECLLNDNLFIMSGDQVVDFDKMVKAFKPLKPVTQGRLSMSLLNSSAAWRNMTDIQEERKTLRKGARKSLLALVKRFANRECEDPRDKFYGFRALACDGNSLHVDYRNEPIDILLQVISNCNWDCFSGMAQYYNGPPSGDSSFQQFGWDLSRQHFSLGSSQPWRRTSNYRTTALSGEVRRAFRALRIPRYESEQGLRHSASDWLVHRVKLVPVTRLRTQVSVQFCQLFSSDESLATPTLSGYMNYWAYYSVMVQLVPSFDAHIHSVYISFGGKLLVTLDHRNGAILAGVSGDTSLFREFRHHKAGRKARTEGVKLQLMFSRMANRHIWPCRVTLGMHTSRLFLVALSTIDEEDDWPEILKLLTKHNTSPRDEPIGKCTCMMPEGLPPPEPPPWRVSCSAND